MSQKARRKISQRQKNNASKSTRSQQVLAYDLGGTKVAVGVVNSRGRVLKELREPVVIHEGKAAVIRQLVRMGRTLLESYPLIQRVGIASAGPLDPKKGVLLDPTNFAGPDGPWGVTPLASLLKKQLALPVVMDNDAAAAMIAEHWVGKAKRVQNAMILTLGTGLGTGILANGELVRAGQHLHPEAGHLILQAHDRTAKCGCGNYGCAEAYLSGRNFGRRVSIQFGRPEMDAKEIADLARNGNKKALRAFDEYAEMLAIALHNYAVIYCPEVIIFAGSFAGASDLFLNKAELRLKELLKRRRKGVDLMPKLVVSSLHNQSGIIGGAWLAFQE